MHTQNAPPLPPPPTRYLQFKAHWAVRPSSLTGELVAQRRSASKGVQHCDGSHPPFARHAWSRNVSSEQASLVRVSQSDCLLELPGNSRAVAPPLRMHLTKERSCGKYADPSQPLVSKAVLSAFNAARHGWGSMTRRRSCMLQQKKNTFNTNEIARHTKRILRMFVAVHTATGTQRIAILFARAIRYIYKLCTSGCMWKRYLSAPTVCTLTYARRPCVPASAHVPTVWRRRVGVVLCKLLTHLRSKVSRHFLYAPWITARVSGVAYRRTRLILSLPLPLPLSLPLSLSVPPSRAVFFS